MHGKSDVILLLKINQVAQKLLQSLANQINLISILNVVELIPKGYFRQKQKVVSFSWFCEQNYDSSLIKLCNLYNKAKCYNFYHLDEIMTIFRTTIVILLAYTIICDVTIKSSTGDLLYPYNSQQNNYCNSQQNLIQFQNLEALTISYPQQFTVTIYTEKQNMLLLGIGKSQPIQNHHEATISIQAHCRISTYIVNHFTAIVIIKPLSYWNNQKSDKIVLLQLPAIIYCMSKSQIPTLQTLALLGYWSIWAFIHAFLEIPPLISMSFSKRLIMGCFLLSTYWMPTQLKHFLQLVMLYLLGVYLNNEIYYKNNRNAVKIGYRIGWAVICLISLFFMFIEIQLPNFGTVFFFLNEILSMERVIILFSMLIFVARLRHMCLIIILSLIMKMNSLKPIYDSIIIDLPTPFPTNCLKYPIFTILIYLPIVHYLRSIMPKYNVLGLFVVFLLAYEGLTEKMIFITMIVFIVSWLVLMSALKSPNYVINYNRSNP